MSFWWNKFLLGSGLYRLFPSYRARLAPVEEQLPFLSDRLLSAPPEIEDDTFRPELHGPDTIHLAQSYPPLKFLPMVRVSRSERLPDLQGLPELRREIRGCTRFIQGEGAELLITAGATGAFAAVLDAFVNPGDRVALFDPSSPIFSIGLKHRRANLAWLPAQVEGGRIRIDADHFRRAIRGSKLLILNDPHNPTGATFAREDLEPIAFWANKYNVLVYSDESYAPYRYDGTQSRFASLPHLRNRVLSVRSCAVGYGLDSAPVGWISACDSLIRACRVAQGLQVSGPSVLDQQAALQAIREGLGGKEAFVSELRSRADDLVARLLQLGLKPVRPAAGYYCWVAVDSLGLTGRQFARELLVSKRVLVQAGDLFGPSGKNFVRISFATESGRLAEGLNRLVKFVEELRPKGAAVPNSMRSVAVSS